ncbi:MAG: DUF1844 domain-containing protein [Planctomycetes bacterium]|nr:DUF1844 domain-containing protein [Planctomycetota bacterium]
MAEEEKKIIVDDDWKEEAKKDKEKLAEEEKVEEAKQEKAEQEKGHGPFPKGDFAALVSLLTTQAFYAMGVLNVEGQDDRKPDLGLAKYNIDMLETLEAKTKGNLTEQEEKVLSDTLSQLRMVYVQVAG